MLRVLLYVARVHVQKQIEAVEENVRELEKLDESLLQVIPLYAKCEEAIAVYAEEAQAVKGVIRFEEKEVPEWIFQLLR